MLTIAIVPDNSPASPTRFRAVAGEVQSVGATAGKALDALIEQLVGLEMTALIVIQSPLGDGSKLPKSGVKYAPQEER